MSKFVTAKLVSLAEDTGTCLITSRTSKKSLLSGLSDHHDDEDTDDLRAWFRLASAAMRRVACWR